MEVSRVSRYAAPIAQSSTSRKAIEAVYDQLIADLSAGDFATLTLDDGENKPTTRNRLKSAAQRRGMEIVFRRTRDNPIIFHLEQESSEDATAVFAKASKEEE